MKPFFSLVQLSRPINLLFILLVQLMVINRILRVQLDSQLISILIATQLITAAGYIINDYFDTKTDAINKPNRMLVGRTVNRSTVLVTVFIFNSISLALMLYHSLYIFTVCAFIVFLLWLYSYSLKKVFLLGNLLVALLTIAPIHILPYRSFATDLKITSLCWFIFGVNLIREIVKDCEDVKGDQKINAKTLPIVLGFVPTQYIITIGIVIFNFFLWKTSFIYDDTLFQIPCLIISLLSTLTIFYVYKTSEGYTKASITLKVLMLVGCLSILIL